VGIQSSLGLLDGLGIFLNINMMCAELRINALYVRMLPVKSLFIFRKDLNNFLLLLLI